MTRWMKFGPIGPTNDRVSRITRLAWFDAMVREVEAFNRLCHR
jgi:hypothetical protein